MILVLKMHILQPTCHSLILLRRAQWAHEYVCSNGLLVEQLRDTQTHVDLWSMSNLGIQ